METRSKKRNRQRLMQSYVPRRPDLPAIFESLNDDTLTTVLEFVGDKSYKSFGGLNYQCREIYLSSGMTKKTFLFGYAPLSVIKDRYDSDPSYSARVALGKGVVFYNRRDIFEWALQERESSLLRRICNVAAEEGRVDLLEEVLINFNNEGARRCIFSGVDESAAGGGKLKVLKWYEERRGAHIWKNECANRAAEKGHINILKWLKEEKGVGLKSELYNSAIYNGHLHEMKWLKEQGCPWSEFTFKYAAEEGNLEILQWLHDKGCPWPEETDDGNRVRVDQVKPEVIDWCREKGYGNRIW